MDEPVPDDRLLWELHVSGFAFPSMTAADELGMFESLAHSPGTAQELADRLHLNRRAVSAVLSQLAAAGVLSQRGGQYYLTEAARNFLLRDSRFYWGPVFAIARGAPPSHAGIVGALRAPEMKARWDAASENAMVNAWSMGSVPEEVARAIASYMHVNCLPAAITAAQRLKLGETRKLLDVGAGAGSFSIAFAQAYPSLVCTLMDLPGMAQIAMRYVVEAGVADRIQPVVVDMFRQAWPAGHDAVFVSNIFHDWDPDACVELARRAYQALPSGGRMHVHEMLLDETRDGPTGAVGFSMYMLMRTKGQQFTASEIDAILRSAGFGRTELLPAHGHFFIVSAVKP